MPDSETLAKVSSTLSSGVSASEPETVASERAWWKLRRLIDESRNFVDAIEFVDEPHTHGHHAVVAARLVRDAGVELDPLAAAGVLYGHAKIRHIAKVHIRKQREHAVVAHVSHLGGEPSTLDLEQHGRLYGIARLGARKIGVGRGSVAQLDFTRALDALAQFGGRLAELDRDARSGPRARDRRGQRSDDLAVEFEASLAKLEVESYTDLLPGRQAVQGGNEDGPPEELPSESRLEFIARRIIDGKANDPFGPRIGLPEALSAVLAPFRHQSPAPTRHRVPAFPPIGQTAARDIGWGHR